MTQKLLGCQFNKVNQAADWEKAKNIFLKRNKLLNHQNIKKLPKKHQQS